MDDKITALIVTADESKADAVAAAFAELDGYEVRVEAAGFGDCIGTLRQSGADVAVVFLDEQPGSGVVILEEIKKTRETIFAFAVSNERSADVIVKAIRAGADELLSDMPTAEELLKAVVKVAERRKTSGGDQAIESRTVVLYAPHGGAGTTTLSVNLAVAIKRLTGSRVVLVDLDLQSAETPVFLNFAPAYTIVDVCQGIDGLDASFLKGSLHSHDSGIDILAPPTNIEDSEMVRPADVSRVLEMLATTHEYVICDTGSYLNEVCLAAIDAADSCYLLTDNLVPSVRATQRTLDALTRLNVDSTLFQLVLNRPAAKSEITAKDMGQALKAEIVATLPFDDNTAVTSTNQGVPLRDVNPKSPLVQAIDGIARKECGVEEESGKSRRLLGRFFSEARQ